MTVDLGDLAGIATALGLVDAEGGLVGDWFSRPGHYLSSVLADDAQRAALLEIADEFLGGPDGTTDDAGRRWIPVADVPDAGFTAAAVVAELADRVHLGAGIRVSRTTQSGVGLDLQAFVPLFASARAGTGSAAVDPVLLGRPARTSSWT